MRWLYCLITFVALFAIAPSIQAQSTCQAGAYGLPYTTTQDISQRNYKHLCVTATGQITYTVDGSSSGGVYQQPLHTINLSTSSSGQFNPFSAEGFADIGVDLSGVTWVNNGVDINGSAVKIGTMPGAILRSFDGVNTGCIFQLSNSTCFWFDPINNFFEFGAALNDNTGWVADMTNHLISETNQSVPWDLGSSLRPWGNIYTGALHVTGGCTSATSPAVCGSSTIGSVAIPAGTNPTLVINTTAASNAAFEFLQVDNTKGTILSVTCNTTLPTGPPIVTSKVNGTSITVQIPGTFTTNPVCINFIISKP